MDLGESLATLVSVGVPLVLLVTLGVKLRRRRLFAYFRVIDDGTKQPLAGAEVSRVAGRRSRIIGTLDAKGEFRGVFGHNSGAFVVSAPGIVSGLIGTEWVSEYGRFPDAPYVCTLQLGRIVPPLNSSPVRRGLAPGKVSTVREGYLYLYEKPDQHGAWLCWATLEEAKSHAKATAMNDNYWKIRGNVVGPGIGGSSCLVEAESIERA